MALTVVYPVQAAWAENFILWEGQQPAQHNYVYIKKYESNDNSQEQLQS
jgi:hypothetical protein